MNESLNDRSSSYWKFYTNQPSFDSINFNSIQTQIIPSYPIFPNIIIKTNIQQSNLYDNSTKIILPSNQNHFCEQQNSNINKKSRILFTKEEDEKIKALVQVFGTKKWIKIASYIHGRTSKQCRDRYLNYLVPGYFNGEWSKEEDELLLKLYEKYGSKWTIIQRSFQDRSANALKNRWNYFLSRQINDKNNNSSEDSNPKNEKVNNITQAKYQLNYKYLSIPDKC